MPLKAICSSSMDRSLSSIGHFRRKFLYLLLYWELTLCLQISVDSDKRSSKSVSTCQFFLFDIKEKLGRCINFFQEASISLEREQAITPAQIFSLWQHYIDLTFLIFHQIVTYTITFNILSNCHEEKRGFLSSRISLKKTKQTKK